MEQKMMVEEIARILDEREDYDLVELIYLLLLKMGG